MTTLPNPTVTVFMGAPFDPGDVFVLDDPTRGLLDGATYTLGGDEGSTIVDAHDVHIQRGRRSELDENDTGTCVVALHNYDRDFDPLNTTSPYFGLLTAGSRIVVTVYGETIFDGHTETWPLTYEVSGVAAATVFAVDGFGDLARREFDEWTTTADQLTGARITAVLNRGEVQWPGGQRDIDTGVATLQADLVTWGSNVLNYLQLVNQSELGNLYCDRHNVLTFRDRHDLIDTTVLATFTDDGTDTPFHGGELTPGSSVLLNRVGIDREGGTLQTAEDTTSVTAYGLRPLNRTGLLMTADSNSLDMAEFLLEVYKDPLTRVSAITVNVTGLTDAQQGVVARLDLNDVIRVVWTPRSTGSEIDQTSQILSVEHSIPVGGPHIMRFGLAPVSAAQSAPFTLDDATDGLLDTGVLAF